MLIKWIYQVLSTHFTLNVFLISSTLYTKCKKQNLLDFFRYEDQSL